MSLKGFIAIAVLMAGIVFASVYLWGDCKTSAIQPREAMAARNPPIGAFQRVVAENFGFSEVYRFSYPDGLECVTVIARSIDGGTSVVCNWPQPDPKVLWVEPK